MTSSGASELTICLNPAGLKRTLWWRERDSVVRHVDRSNYSHFRAVELPISCCAAAQPKAHHEKHTKKTRLQWLQGSFFAQGRCVCLVPLHRGRHVRPVESPPSSRTGCSATICWAGRRSWLADTEGSLFGSEQRRSPSFCVKPDQDAPQFLRTCAAGQD